MVKGQKTLRVWHGKIEELEQFLKRRPRDRNFDFVTVFTTTNPRLSMWAFGNLDLDVIETLGLTFVRRIDLDKMEQAA